MAAVTTVESFVSVLGPRKMEVASLSSVDTGDTYTTTIQNPKFGYFVPTTSAGALTAAVTVTISGRVVTLASADLSASTGVLTIFGF